MSSNRSETEVIERWRQTRLEALARQPVLWADELDELEKLAVMLGISILIRRTDLNSDEVTIYSIPRTIVPPIP